MKIVPIVLAAGDSGRLTLPKPLARFGARTALEIAVENCRALPARPVVVLGHRAAEIRPFVPPSALIVVNRRWRAGMLGSILAGLRKVPRGAPFLIYPVDHPLIRKQLVLRLARAFAGRRPGQFIVMPRRGKRPGHPVIFAPDLRQELRRARTAREIGYRDSTRVLFLPVRSPAIFEDFDSPESYRRLAARFRSR